MNNPRSKLCEAKRIVVKVGTSTLTYSNGNLNFTRIEKLVRVLSDLMNQEKEIVLVTSGAIGVGVGKLKLQGKPETIREKQAVAAVGQCELMQIYSRFFSEYGHVVGQILLTRDIVENKAGKHNVINTFDTLIEKGILPIVNENDSVAVDEIECDITRVFGDNDTLSAIVAEVIGADLLIILSDIDGFYDSDPKENSDSKLISVIDVIDDDIEKCAGGAGTSRGTGGMVTKLHAAKIALNAGIDMALINGSNPELIMDVIEGKDTGTLFKAK